MSATEAPESRDYPRSLVLLMLVQFGAGGALYPFLAPILKSNGFTVESISWIVFASSSVSAVVPFLWGALADRVLPVNRLVVGMHVVAAALLAAWSRCETFPMVLVFFALYSAFAQPTHSLVSALTFHHLKDSARQFGGLRMWGSVGWMLPSAPIAVWLWYRGSQTFHSAVWFAVGAHLLFAAMYPLWPHTPPLGRGPGAKRFVHDVRELIRQPGFIGLLIVTFFTLASFPVMFFFTSEALDRAGIPKPWLGPVMSIGVALEVPLFYWLRAFLDRFGLRAVLAAGIFAAIVRQIVFAFSSEPLPLILASLLIAPSIVFFLIGASLAVNQLAAKEVRATAQSLFTLSGSGLGSMCGLLGCALLSGFSEDVDDLTGPFLLAASLATAGLVSLPLARLQRLG